MTVLTKTDHLNTKVFVSGHLRSYALRNFGGQFTIHYVAHFVCVPIIKLRRSRTENLHTWRQTIPEAKPTYLAIKDPGLKIYIPGGKRSRTENLHTWRQTIPDGKPTYLAANNYLAPKLLACFLVQTRIRQSLAQVFLHTMAFRRHFTLCTKINRTAKCSYHCEVGY
jgi:hypothetical protein